MLLELLVKYGRCLSVTCSPNRPFERTAATVGLIAVLRTAAGVPFSIDFISNPPIRRLKQPSLPHSPLVPS